MGGRGTYSVGIMAPYQYHTVGFIDGVKILEGIKGKHNLPEEAHSSLAYIRLDKRGRFHELRLYDKDHYLYFELAYHPEPKIDPLKRPVYHYHPYNRRFERTEAKKATKAMRKHFERFLKGAKA